MLTHAARAARRALVRSATQVTLTRALRARPPKLKHKGGLKSCFAGHSPQVLTNTARDPTRAKGFVAVIPDPRAARSLRFSPSFFYCFAYHARMARRAQHLRCSLCERSERGDNKLDNRFARTVDGYHPSKRDDPARVI